MAGIDEANGDLSHLEEHHADENDKMLRLRYVGRRDLSVPGKIQEKNILSKFGTVRGVRNRVRAGIANFSGVSTQVKKIVSRRGCLFMWAWSSVCAIRLHVLARAGVFCVGYF